MHLKKNNNYTSNVLSLSFPDGLDVEVFELETLIKAQNLSRSSLNKEHVTKFIESLKDLKSTIISASKLLKQTMDIR